MKIPCRPRHRSIFVVSKYIVNIDAVFCCCAARGDLKLKNYIYYSREKTNESWLLNKYFYSVFSIFLLAGNVVVERGAILENLKFYGSDDSLLADVGNGAIQSTE